MKKYRLGIIGCGHLGSIIANACKEGLLEDYELVGVLGKTPEKAENLAVSCNCKACADIEELLALKPDYIAEAASVEAVKKNAVKILSNGCSMVLLSIGALADQEFYQDVLRTAKEHGTKIHIASGAIGGFDVLRTVTLMGAAENKKGITSGISTRKGPASLKNTPLFEDRLMTDTEETKVFHGDAKTAISLLPTKVNVAVATAISTAGPENTSVDITSVPGMAGDDHKITADTEGIHAVVDIYSRTSDIAGWSVVSLLQNLVSPIMF